MNQIITQSLEKLKQRIEEFFEEDNQSIECAEKELNSAVNECICELLTEYYEKLDEEILKDKAGRKKAGLVVERKKEQRHVLTRFGMVAFSRTYYSKQKGGYTHPVDAVAGLEGYERISLGLAEELCDKARTYSYTTASDMACNGYVSKQTVMNKIRLVSRIEESAKEQEKRKVAVLHIDADEDHISLQDGTNTIAPLVSVYEGINSQTKRHYCENISHYPFFETKADDIWERVLQSIEEEYDLTDTKIYVHGDGAPWIKTAEDWLPNVVPVLDRYHYNKYKKIVLACLRGTQRGNFSQRIHSALVNEDESKVIDVWEELLSLNPEREEQLNQAFCYLLNNMSEIAIYQKDPEARRGGATEPHVSHVLSERLSMKPLGWSRETLRHLVPYLGTGSFALNRQPMEPLPIVHEKVHEMKRAKPKYALGLVDPDAAVEFAAKNNKVTPLFRALKPF